LGYGPNEDWEGCHKKACQKQKEGGGKISRGENVGNDRKEYTSSKSKQKMKKKKRGKKGCTGRGETADDPTANAGDNPRGQRTREGAMQVERWGKRP